jgi:beta-lactamase class A
MRRAVLAVPLVAVIAGAALFAAGWHAHRWSQRATSPRPSRTVRLGRAGLVNPLLDIELPPGYSVDREPISFIDKVERLVNERARTGKVREASVYYRDLQDGPWFGLNQDRRYDPASMMKVPVMVAWLKRAEKDPAVLQRSFVFDERSYPGSWQALPSDRTLADGQRYTVDELLRYMLAYSDNRAMSLLFAGLGQDELGAVLDSMDVTNETDGISNSMTVHGYSGIFRILYNAAFLDRERSEKALRLLALQDFPRGIVAGVPKGVVVASKFGEMLPATPGGDVQLHEFGIVYHPRGPYILGIMTVGRDWSAQADLLRDVSALVYREIEAQLSPGSGVAHR